MAEILTTELHDVAMPLRPAAHGGDMIEQREICLPIADAPSRHPVFGCIVFWSWYVTSWVIGVVGAGVRIRALITDTDGARWFDYVGQTAGAFFAWMFAWPFFVSVWLGVAVMLLLVAALSDMARAD